MGPLLVILAFAIVIAIVNILALVEGRSGSTLPHKAMFICAGVGLLSLTVMIGSAFALGAMLIVATANSPQGRAFEVSASMCAISTLGSLLLYTTIAPRRG
jgi:hypothetical protein